MANALQSLHRFHHYKHYTYGDDDQFYPLFLQWPNRDTWLIKAGEKK